MAAKICPVILSGGSGTRLWPQSRTSYHKQFLPLVFNQSLLQETIRVCSKKPRNAYRIPQPSRHH
jgi:mannose-1-phosphate guanylyltransferase